MFDIDTECVLSQETIEAMKGDNEYKKNLFSRAISNHDGIIMIDLKMFLSKFLNLLHRYKV